MTLRNQPRPLNPGDDRRPARRGTARIGGARATTLESALASYVGSSGPAAGVAHFPAAAAGPNESGGSAAIGFPRPTEGPSH
jgi:hypothetical protein